MKIIPNSHVQELFGHHHFEGLDGELIVGDPTDADCFRKTMSGVMADGGTPDVSFNVFDHIGPNLERSFSRRLMLAASMTGVHHPLVPVFMVAHKEIKNEEELLEYEAARLCAGYEGVMLRDPHGPYKFGRSTLKQGWLMKLKRFVDGEAEILGLEELMHNANPATFDELGHTVHSSHKEHLVGMSTLGSLYVRDLVTGVVFNVGTGFDATERETYWRIGQRLVGQVIKYKHFPIGAKDKPRHPVYLGFRDLRDL